MDDHDDGVKVRTRLEPEPIVSVDEVYEESETLRACAHSVELFVEVHNVKRHAIVDVPLSSSCQRRHWCSYRRAFRPNCFCPLCRPNSHTVVVHPTLFPEPFFTYVFTVFSQHFRCGIYTCHGRSRLRVDSRNAPRQ